MTHYLCLHSEENTDLLKFRVKKIQLFANKKESICSMENFSFSKKACDNADLELLWLPTTPRTMQ